MTMDSPSIISASSGPRADRFRFSPRRLFVWILWISIALAIFITLANAIQNARQAAIASASQAPLNQLQHALRDYHWEHGHFPPAFIADENGTPIRKRPIQLASLGKISSQGPSVSFLGLACFLLVFSVGSY